MTDSHIPVIIAAAAITYLTRVTGLSLGNWQPPIAIRYLLGYVPVAAFAALVAPDLSHGGDDAAPRLVGAAVAAVVAYRIGKLWVCIAVGMAVFWLMRAVV